ncbi:MAG TPA: cysteine--tRNA ligase [Candidatus Magasanikbacteria bacterium]|nr:cysteine--tRNA ligase [Candidatus Magasanikbacteria bacterium]
MTDLKLHNTLTRKIETFKPITHTKVGLYTCGPTVYDYAHIGNLRTYVFEDILKRTLAACGYQVTHVMNITDVGHLSGDDDTGIDKMEKGAKREGKTAWDIAEFYTTAFKKHITELNILLPDIWCKATDHIAEQIEQVQVLTDKGYTYETTDGIYFDTTKFPEYGEMALLHKQELQAGARVDLGEKKNVHDFAVWKFSNPVEKRQMEWEAFGRMGFPGWHIECSAMSMKYLGGHFDIHCGGVDHIPVHHTNEIAQAECAGANHPWVNYWLHGEFLLIDDSKMSKSDDNFITLDTLTKEHYSPLAYRYFLLQAHYRKQLSFSWEALDAAVTGLKNLYRTAKKLGTTVGSVNEEYMTRFIETLMNDLNTAEALALAQELLKSDVSPEDKLATLYAYDHILGLDIQKAVEEKIEIPPSVASKLTQRAFARQRKDWEASDRLRDEINELGFDIDDTSDGQDVSPRA